MTLAHVAPAKNTRNAAAQTNKKSVVEKETLCIKKIQ